MVTAAAWFCIALAMIFPVFVIGWLTVAFAVDHTRKLLTRMFR